MGATLQEIGSISERSRNREWNLLRAFLAGFLLILILPRGAEGAFLQVKGALHVHTSFSTGTLSLEEIIEQARSEGIDSVIFSENLLLRFEYGLSPFRGLLKKVVEKPSVLQGDIRQWLESIKAARTKFPDVILIPGVEAVPYYYYTGSLLRGDLTMHDTQKNLLAVGFENAEDYLKIPAIGNDRALSHRPHLLKLGLGLGLVGLGVFLARTRREKKIQLKHFSVKVQKPYRVSRWLALGSGTLLLLESLTAAGLNPYRGDLGIEPYQQLIDSVEARGGMVFWSYVEARDFHEQTFRPFGRLTIQTKPHREVLLQSHGYTAFGAVYQDNVTVTEPGAEWDQLLLEYMEGSRPRPIWGIGELGYHGPPKRLGDVLTVFLVPERSREAILDALKLGRFYGVHSKPDYRLVLEDFSIGQKGSSEWVSMGGELEADGEALLQVCVRIGASDGREVPFTLRLIRSGTLFRVIQGTTPFAETLAVTPPDRGRRDFFRIDIVKPHPLVSNPIFIRRRA